MYKIMLVEDEPAVLNAMTGTLDWNALSFHKPVACADGRAAIQAVEDGFIPDAVITDICMPFVDGVELAEYFALQCPNTLIVMLTGYDDFAYAHKAIKLKVYDYILKPITPKNLRQLAQRLCDELENRRIKNFDEIDALARERFFIQLLSTNLDEKTISDNMRVHGVNPCGNYWTVLVADLGIAAPVTAVQSRDAELARYGLGNILTELAQELDCCVACVPVKETFCVVLGCEFVETLTSQARELANRTAEMCKLIKQSVTCGIGTPVTSFKDLNGCYLQAVLALNYRFFFGNIPCISSDDVEMRPTTSFTYAPHEQALTCAIKLGSRENALLALNEMCVAMQTQKLPYEQCLRICQRTVLHLLDLIGEYISSDDMTNLERAWDNTNLFAANTMPLLQEMLQSMCNLAFDSFERAGQDDATQRVRKAEAYIREHYKDEDLSLNTIRDVFAISVSYFSAIFKAGTGTTFVEYLTQIRIERARELLSVTEKRAGEIAAEVGFADPHYFSITFKRITGLTPREYRAQNKQL